MKIRLPLGNERVFNAARLALVSLSCVFLITSCGTNTDTANTYTKSVTAVDESGAARTLKTIQTAQATFAVSHGGEYGSFADLTGSALLDERFAGQRPEMGGYVYTMRLLPSSGGQAPMYAVIHANSSQPASASDPSFP